MDRLFGRFHFGAFSWRLPFEICGGAMIRVTVSFEGFDAFSNDDFEHQGLTHL